MGLKFVKNKIAKLFRLTLKYTNSEERKMQKMPKVNMILK